jgi:gluconokinase
VIVIVMGVSGSGKSTIGARLAGRLGFPFLDADDFHPPANVAKMSAGIPLGDEDRRPWLELVNSKLKQHKEAVLACSALKQSYREILVRDVPDPVLVFLKGGIGLIRSRLESRKHRYMPATLLQSQFDVLEPPARALEIDVERSVEDCVAEIETRLQAR